MNVGPSSPSVEFELAELIVGPSSSSVKVCARRNDYRSVFLVSRVRAQNCIIGPASSSVELARGKNECWSVFLVKFAEKQLSFYSKWPVFLVKFA
nr:hypothetical protein tc_p042c [Abalone herpesvirus Taiwan/2004]